MMAQLIGPLVTGLMGFAIALTLYGSIKKVGKLEGGNFERARVLAEEKKTHDRIATKQRAAAKQPANSVLDRWSQP